MAMANPQRGQVGFEVDGVPYLIVMGANALCALEEAFDLDSIVDIEPILEGLKTRPKMVTVRTLFHAGLAEHHDDLTEADAGRLMTAIGLNVAAEKIGQAFQLAFAAEEADGTADPRKPAVKAAGIGASSSRTGAKPGSSPKRSGGKPRA
jgi:hypothetical protein